LEADKSKDKNIIIGDPRTPNMSCRVATRKALDKIKIGGTGGQARSDTRSQSPVLRTSDSPGTKAGQSETRADSPAMKAGRSANDQKQQQPQTVEPQHYKTSIRNQNTSKTSGRLNRVGPTFDHLLAKYMKTVVPHNQPIKQTKSKGWSVRKQKPTKPAQKVAQPRLPSHPLLGMAWCFQSIHRRCDVLHMCGVVRR
jgi:hypothetical protein